VKDLSAVFFSFPAPASGTADASEVWLPVSPFARLPVGRLAGLPVWPVVLGYKIQDSGFRI